MRRLKPTKSDGSQGRGMAVRGTADWNRNEGAERLQTKKQWESRGSWRGGDANCVCVCDYLMLPNSHVRWGHRFPFIDVDDEGRSQPAPQMLGARDQNGLTL